MKNKISLKNIIIIILAIILISTFVVRRNAIENQKNIQSLAMNIFFETELVPPPNITFNTEIILDFTNLVERENFTDLKNTFNNDEIVGYLTIDETSINYPVLQYTDNQFYLNNDIHKNPSIAGSIYLDYENNIEKLDYNTVIYGHNMRDDIMFHSLRYYKDKEYYDQHKYIKFSTLYNDYVYEIFSAYETSITFPYITVLFNNEDEFYELSSQFAERSLYDTGVELSKDDKVLTLSTCTSSSLDPNSRFVVQGKLVSINGDSIEDNTILTIKY